MSIILNDNIKINAGKPSESKYLNTGNTAYSGSTLVVAKEVANIAVSISERHLGLTVLLLYSGETNVEYWWKTGVTDVDLIEKKFSSEQLVSDFVTGATNLGFFSGFTGIQRLDLSGAGFGANEGDYYSEYNWYYSDASGVIKLGSPTYDGDYRRAYVNEARDKSWIYDMGTAAWIISLNDVVDNVGNIINGSSYTGTGFTNVTWSGDSYNGSVMVTAYGDLNTGNTYVFGNPIYNNKVNSELTIRTIISDTPDILNIEYDDYYIKISGTTTENIISVENVGTGVGIYSGITGTTILLKTLVGNGGTTITDNGSEIIIDAGGGSGESVLKEITQLSHNFNVNDVIGWSDGLYSKAIADGTYDGEILGIVNNVCNANEFTLVQSGYVSGLTGLDMNLTYFVSPDVAGEITTTAPTTINYLVKPVLIANSSISGWVLPYSGYIISNPVSGNGGALIKSVCLPTISPYQALSSDYYVGVSGGCCVTLPLSPDCGMSLIVADVNGDAAVGCAILITGNINGYPVAEIDTTFGSLSFIYNGTKWGITAFSPALS